MSRLDYQIPMPSLGTYFQQNDDGSTTILPMNQVFRIMDIYGQTRFIHHSDSVVEVVKGTLIDIKPNVPTAATIEDTSPDFKHPIPFAIVIAESIPDKVKTPNTTTKY